MALIEFQHRGLSMLSTLKPNDQIIVETDYTNPSVGDIVVFRDHNNNEFVAHRLIQINPLVAKGDNAIIDEQISREQIIGLVVARVRNGRMKKMSKMESIVKGKISPLYHQKYQRPFRGLFKFLIRLI